MTHSIRSRRIPIRIALLAFLAVAVSWLIALRCLAAPAPAPAYGPAYALDGEQTKPVTGADVRWTHAVWTGPTTSHLMAVDLTSHSHADALVDSGTLADISAFATPDAPAPAAGAPKKTAFETFMDGVLDMIAAAAAASLMGIATAMLKKNGITLTVEQQALFKGWATQAIHYVEERAVLLGKEASRKISGPEKLQMAIDFMKRKAFAAKIPLTDSQAHDEIHAALPASPFGAVKIDGLS